MNMQVDNYGALDNLNGGLEVSELEIKKQRNQTQRFGNPAFKEHPQLGNIRSALSILEPEQLLKVLKNAGSALSGRGGTTNIEQDRPQLALPRSSEPETSVKGSAETPEKELSGFAKATALLGKVMQLCEQASQQNILQNVSFINALFHGQGLQYLQLSEALETEGAQWASDFDALQAAQQQANALQQNVSSAQDSLGKAQGHLSELEMTAAQQDPVSPALQKQIDEAKNAVVSAQTNLTTATSQYNHHVTATLNPAIKAEGDSKAALAITQQKARELVDSLPPQRFRVIEAKIKQENPNAKGLTFLMALISQLINQSSSEDLNATAELKKKLSEAAAKDAEKKAAEYEEQVRKAEELQNTLGCVGKIFAYVVTAALTAAALVTGGATLILVAGIGVAMLAAEEIQTAMTGSSFMSDGMQWVMEKVLQPLVDLYSKIFTAVLKEFGVSDEKAEMVGKILGAIQAVIVMIGTLVVAGSVAKSLVSHLMKSLGKNISSQLLKNMMTNVSHITKSFTQGFGRSLGMGPVQTAQFATRIQSAVTVGTFLNSIAQAGGGIVAAHISVKASEARAQMMNDAAMQTMLNEIMSRAVDIFTLRMETVNSIVKNISAVAESQIQAGKYITRRMSSVAG
ncbi:type III secretion system translocon subunit SctE [Erwinia tasmaniensis]|uniref:Invasin-like protein (62 kDa antigen) n=1 Tax=Erwinia tasmaniensis (strain DSM 17950 / CFBP 7177 / CIP 109463 / NCPPB 4357 / Et1/99) TaxID=465817 RepID=B2VG10_ERWT9|nr:type III secretion system translocon subunit SctE [Erwinia tasmaniensis]CAO97728.1 Putative Invasin-like protein (62 kDa antigen) [Erwinia tasmaniensis Et1/99]